MDNKATKSKDNLRAAGKKRLEEFRQKRQQKVEGAAKVIVATEASASPLEDEQAADVDPSSAIGRSSLDKDDNASVGSNNYAAVEPEAEATTELSDIHQIQDGLSEEKALRDSFFQPDNEKFAISAELDACLSELRLSKERVEDLEGRLSGEIVAVKEERDRVLAEFHKAHAENNYLASQLEVFKSQIESAHAERGGIEGQLHALNLQLEKCSSERDKLVWSLTSCQDQLKEKQGHESQAKLDFEARTQQLTDEIEILKQDKVKVECDKQKLAEKLEEAQQSRGAIVEELQNHLKTANEDKSALSIDLDVLNKKLETVSYERSHFKQKLECCETKEAEVSSKLSSLEDQLQIFDLENQQLVSELGRYRKTVAEAESQNAQLTADIEELKTELRRTSDEKSQFASHHEILLTELQLLKTGRVQLESELTSVIKQFQEVEQGLRHQISRNEEEKIAVIVEFENLVSQVQKLLEDDTHLAGDIDLDSCKPPLPERIITRFVTIFHILQKRTEEKMNFRADYDKCRGEKEELLQKLTEEEKWKEKLESEKRVLESMSNEELQRLTTANLQLISGTALMKDQLEEMSREKEGQAVEINRQLQSRDQEIDKVKEENADLLNQLAKLSQKLQELHGMNRAFQVDIETLRSDIQRVEDEKIQQLDAAKQQQEKLSESDSLKDQLLKLLEERGAENAMLRNQVEVLHAELDKEREYFGSLQDQSVVINDFEHQLKALKDENVNLKFSCLDHENTVQKLKEQLHYLESQLARLNQEVTLGDANVAEQHQDKRAADRENILQSELEMALQKITELEENGKNHISAVDSLEASVALQQQQLNEKIGVLAVENESMLEEAKRECFRLEARVETLQKEISEMDLKNNRVGDLIEKAITAVVPDQTFYAYDDMEGCVASGLSILIGKIKETQNQLQRLGAQVSELDKTLVTVNLERQMGKEAALQKEHDILDELAKARLHEKQLQLELEQTNQKLLSTREKLSLAVNKDKGLVQQRDALKQTIGELEAAHEEDLRDRDIALQEVRAQLKALEMSSEALKSEMASTKDVIKLLQERNASFEIVAQIIDGISSTSDFVAVDLAGKVKWLIEAQRKALAAEQMSSKTVEALTEELKIFQEKVELLNDEITAGKQEKYDILAKLENLTSQHSRIQEVFAQERVSLQDGMASMQAKMDGYAITESKLRSILERMTKFLTDVLDEDTPEVAGSNGVLVQLDLCIDTLTSKSEASHHYNRDLVKQISTLASKVKYLEESKLHLQEGLASKDIELSDVNGKWEEASIKVARQADQIKELLHALESVRATLLSVTNERNARQNELHVASKERDRLQLELSESEQRLVTVREKLGLAIKKGKGLAQQRDELKQSLTEKSSELYSLNASYKEKVQALEVALKDRSLEAERLQSLVVEREKNVDTELQSLKSVAEMKQEELDVCKALLDEARNNEESLVAELASVKRKSAEIVEGKRLLEEAHREVWLRLQEATAKVESLERQKQGLQQEHDAFASLKTILVDMHNLVSESLEKKMAAFTEMEILATEILVLVGGDRSSTEWPQTQETKMIHESSNKDIFAETRVTGNMSEMLDLIKERHGYEVVSFFHRVSKTKKLLEESLEGLASLKQKILKEPVGDFRSVVARLESLEAKEQESVVLKAQLTSKDRELESSFYELQEANAQIDIVSARVEELEDLIKQNHMTMGNMESSRSKAVGKLTFTLGKLSELHQQCEAMLVEIENLQTNLDKCNMEISGLNQKVDLLQKDLQDKSSNLIQLKSKLKILFAKAGGQRESIQDDESHVVVDLLEIEIQRLQRENENFGMIIQRKDEALQDLKKRVDEVTTEKLQLEDNLRGKFKSSASERSAKASMIEIEELDQHPKHATAASTPHIRSQKKVSLADHVTVDMDTDENRLLEEKGHAFKSLGVSRIFPKAGHYFGDRVDALCLLAGKVLMRQPVARLSLIVYWIAIHIWIVTMLSMARV